MFPDWLHLKLLLDFLLLFSFSLLLKMEAEISSAKFCNNQSWFKELVKSSLTSWYRNLRLSPCHRLLLVFSLLHDLLYPEENLFLVSCWFSFLSKEMAGFSHSAWFGLMDSYNQTKCIFSLIKMSHYREPCLTKPNQTKLPQPVSLFWSVLLHFQKQIILSYTDNLSEPSHTKPYQTQEKKEN